jgi:hypothetical protein
MHGFRTSMSFNFHFQFKFALSYVGYVFASNLGVVICQAFDNHLI